MSQIFLGGTIPPDAQLSFGATFEMMLAIVIGIAVVLLGLYLTRRRTQHRYLKLEMGLWTVASLVLGFALSQPTLTSDSARFDNGRFVVLVDRSASMAVMEDGRPRHEQVDDLMRQIRSSVSADIEVYSFDSEINSGMPSTYTGMDSDIGAALTQINDRYLGQQLAGIAVITDGIDRGALGQQLRHGTALQLPEVSGPVTFYSVGSDDDYFDV